MGGRGRTYLDLVQSVGAADAGFALACLLAGAAAGVWWVLAREDEHDARGVARLVGLLAGGLRRRRSSPGSPGLLLHGARAAGDGRRARRDRGRAVPAPAQPRRASPGCLLWPLGVGVLVAVDTLREVAWQALGRGDDDPRG